MRYIGSKSSTVEGIYEISSNFISDGTFCDPFGGTSTVGAYYKSKGFKVFTGDLLLFAHYFQVAKLTYDKLPEFNKLREKLHLGNSLEVMEYFNNMNFDYGGWFIESYAVHRKFFTISNARRIQTCWYKIIEFVKDELVTYHEKAFLLASLINSMDKVANTAGTYYAYLKEFNKKSSKDFKFEFILPVTGQFFGESFLSDANDLIKKQGYDVIYLDPPYNDRRYHSYYHLPETIANCLIPEISGKSGVTKSSPVIESNFYTSHSAVDALSNILDNANFKVLLFHYRDDGLITPQKIDLLFNRYKTLKKYEVESLGYTTSKQSRNSPTQLYTVYNA
jgi:adenine-specific DNA-methyltransferase